MKRLLCGLAMSGVLLAGLQSRAQNVTLTGVIQGANGLPASNTQLNFTPTQTFFVPGTQTTQQVGNIYGNGVPTGTCAVSGQFYTNNATNPGSLYQCTFGVWVPVSPSGVAGVVSINGVAGAFTFSGPTVSCVATVCTFSNSVYVPPTGNGFPHITSGAQDPAARAVDLSTADVTGVLPRTSGGSGTTTPGLVQGTNITITGTWPNQTINATGGTGTPGGANLSLQMNNGGAFGAAPFTTDSTFQQLAYTGANVDFNGSTESIHVNLPCSPTAIPNLVTGTALGQSMCLQILYIPKMPGWADGNSAGSGMGWMSVRPLEVIGRMATAGIHSNIFHFDCDGIGDCALFDGYIASRGAGGLDVSAEGQDGMRLALVEGGETTGTVTVTGNNLTTLPITENQNTNGVGLPIYNPAYDVISTTVTGKVSGATPDYGVMTVIATLPVSLQCSTVAAGNAALGTLQIGTYLSRTVTLNTSVDLNAAGGVGQIAAFVEPVIQRARAVSFGVFNAGAQTQTMTILLNQDVVTGSPYCIGPTSDRGIEQVVFTRNGQVYLVDSIGTPTSHTIWFSSMTSQGPKPPQGANVSAVNIFHIAQIVGVATPGVFNLSENNIHWGGADGSTWISTNIVNQVREDMLIESQWNDPYMNDLGHTWLKNGVSTQDSRFLFMKNETPAANYTDHGGAYSAPAGIIYVGPIAGNIYDTAPESCDYQGNPCVAAAISMGPIAGGSSQTQWMIASNRADGDSSQIAFLPASNSWVLRTPGQGTSDPNGPGFLATTYQFQAGAALVNPTHTIEGSGSSNVAGVGADTTAAVLIENRNGTGATHEDLFFGLEDSFNQRATVGGLAMVNVSNAHAAASGDLHVWLNNAGTPTDWWEFLHGGTFQNLGGTFIATAAGAVTSSNLTDSALSVGQCVAASTAGLLANAGTPCVIQAENVVSFSATPTFSATASENIITLSAPITSSTLAAGAAGQYMTLTFCQNGTGGFAAVLPTNWHGAFTIGTTANKCNSQTAVYSPSQSAWIATTTGVINE